MSKSFPDFHSERDMVEWFENSDLSEYNLEEALNVVVATKLGLVLEDPWTQTSSRSAGTAGATASVEFVGTC